MLAVPCRLRACPSDRADDHIAHTLDGLGEHALQLKPWLTLDLRLVAFGMDRADADRQAGSLDLDVAREHLRLSALACGRHRLAPVLLREYLHRRPADVRRSAVVR